MPLPLIVSCFSKIQIGFTFMVPAHLGIPGKRVVKRVCVLAHLDGPGQRAVKRVCVCVCVCVSRWQEGLVACRRLNLFSATWGSVQLSLGRKTMGLALPDSLKTSVKTLTMVSYWFHEFTATLVVCDSLCYAKKVKVAHTRLPSVGFRSWSRFLEVSLQVMWIINPTVGCHYFPPGLQLLPQPLRGLLPVLLLGEQRHSGCEQFAWDCYPTASRLRFEPRPFCAWVQHANHLATEPLCYAYVFYPVCRSSSIQLSLCWCARYLRPSLRSLDLSYNHLTDLQHLVASLCSLPMLRNLVLYGNPFTVSFALNLHLLKFLQWLI